MRLVLTHFFRDVEQSYQQQYGEKSGVFQVPSPLWDPEYTDDAILLSFFFIWCNTMATPEDPP